jgi:DNA-directed RNA polymerase specialized sigma24 family protein
VSTANWVVEIAGPALRRGIVSVAKQPLSEDAFPQWPEIWQEAFQDATLKLLSSASVREHAAAERWEDVKSIAYRTAANAAIDLVRQRGRRWARELLHDGEGEEDEPAHEWPDTALPPPEEALLLRLRREERVALLARVQSVLDEMPDTPEHPRRRILAIYTHLALQEELTGEDAPEAQQMPTLEETPYWTAYVRSLFEDLAALPRYREKRYDMQIAHILRPETMTGPQATEAGRKQTATWVRTELSRGRKKLLELLQARYGTIWSG